MKGEGRDSEDFNTVIFYIKRAWSDQSEIQQRGKEQPEEDK